LIYGNEDDTDFDDGNYVGDADAAAAAADDDDDGDDDGGGENTFAAVGRRDEETWTAHR